MAEFKIPEIVLKINKDAKRTVITTLKKAKALRLKRMFSGSFCINEMTGGGYAYKRILLLFGSKSSGKNAQLNQMMAFNQRLCRVCHGIRPDMSEDRWIIVLRDILQVHHCQCKDNIFDPKKFYVLDYEKTLAIESPRTIIVQKYIDTKTDIEIDGLDYNDRIAILEELKIKEELTDKQKEWLKETEEWLKHLKIEENKVEQMAATDYLEKCGVIVNELLVSDPGTTEEGVEIIRVMVKSREVDGIILDSLQTMIPKYVKNRDSEEATMGAEPKANALMLRHVCSAFSAEDLEDEAEAYKPPLFITSQVRASLGYGQKVPTYSGGYAVEHLISLALELKREHFLKDDGTKVPFDQTFYGQKVRLRGEKTKLSAPGDIYEFDYYFRDGEFCEVGEIDHVGEIVNIGIVKGLIERAGAWYKTKGEKFNGMNELKKFFRENPTFVGNLYKDILIDKK